MEKIGRFTFRNRDAASAREIAGWQYQALYDIYNCNPNEVEEIVQWFLNPQSQYYTVWNEAGELLGYRCFGEDARVPGGDYSAEALDMGGRLRPERTGQGLGVHIMEAAFEFARAAIFTPRPFAPPWQHSTYARYGCVNGSDIGQFKLLKTHRLINSLPFSCVG